MFTMEERKMPHPFKIICNKCGSDNVQVISFEYHDMEIKCGNCGIICDCGCYNNWDDFSECVL